ncbi:MAG: DNA mismatch repair protein MutS [Planctomycetota bacterium]|jgi:DNA mismatch repair protein MutS
MSSSIGTTDRSRRRRGDSPATPAMRQYARFKAMYPECVLFFRMGDFYEMFHEDAVLAHKALGITLTQRTEGIPMAGVPYHAVENYLRRMIDAGYRVAVCDQVQDPREATGVVERAVTRVLTPGTLVDEALLDEGRTNHVAAIELRGLGGQPAAALSVIELSTGSFWLLDVPAGRVEDEVVRIGPAELLYPESADGAVPGPIESVRAAAGCALTARPPWTFRPREAGEALREHFGVATLGGFGLDDDDPALGAAGAVLRYLQETQTPNEGAASPRLGHLRPPRRRSDDAYVTIDAATLHNLEIERTMRSGTTTDSLLSIFGRCRTGMGKRQLRQWLCFPLRDLAAIQTRQRMVSELVDHPPLVESLAETVAGVQDVARIVGRVSMRRATPRDLVALGASAGQLPAVADLLQGRRAFAGQLGRLTGLAPALGTLAETIRSRCVDAPPAHLREGGLFRDGVDADLDAARTLQRDATGWLAAYQKRLTEETGINSLKVGYNKVFGYYIEITHAHADKVPPAFTRKQTLKNAERYITPELKTFEDKVTTASAEAIEREKVMFEEVCQAAAAEAPALTEYADLIGELDVLACFAQVARRSGFACPQMVEAPALDIRQGRHPVLDRTLGERFVPNDCLLGARREAEDSDGPGDAAAPDPTLVLITGPNMAGKSTYIRQVALIVLLAHAGSFVPAEAATIGLTDRIFTRIGASDELHAGRSTFMVEMTETANILHHATDRSLIILDEIGRGTSTLDGLSLAWAITEALAERGCRTLFATHYHELTALADDWDRVANLHVSVREWGEQIIFLYRILPGRTDRSYGIHVARIAGLPAETVDRASVLLETLAVQTNTPKPGKAPPPAQLSLFTEYLQHPVVDELHKTDLTALTPLEAFDLLRRLREQADHER